MSVSEQTASPLVAFKGYLSAEVVPGDAVYLFSERKVTVLVGRHVELLARLLDGTRDMEAVLRETRAANLPSEVTCKLIEGLCDAGLLTQRGGDDGDESSRAYWEARGLDADRASAASVAPVELIALGQLDRCAMTKELRAHGLVLEQGNAEISVVLCDDYLAPELKEIDARHRSIGRPWLLARPVGERMWVGPFFDPGSPTSACWNCLAQRLWGHRQAEAHVRSALGGRGPVRSLAMLPAMRSTALSVVAVEVMKWLAGWRYQGQSSIWTLDSADLSGRHHLVTRRPQCPACGDPELLRRQVYQPLTLQGGRKSPLSAWGYRAVPPDQVVKQYRHLVSPITGVVKEVKRAEVGPGFLNVYLSGPPAGATASSIKGLKDYTRYSSGGKGVTPAQAEASALCEALERYCARYQGDEASITASLRDLGETAIHPNACQLYHERQFEERHAWNREHATFQFVGERFSDTAKVPWTPVWSLTRGCHRYLPTAMLYFGTPRKPGTPLLRADSNGNAAGTTLEDAILQGLCEVVERDAVAIWWYNRVRQPGVDLDAFGEPWLDGVREGYASLGRQLWVLDLTVDIGVPVMAALSRRTDAAEQRIAFGFGAHLDPRIALRRAVTEMNQLIPRMLDEHAAWDIDGERWCREATVQTQPYLTADPAVRPLTPGDYGFVPSEDLLDDIEAVHGRLRRAELELLVLDQTRPDIGLPVVKVVVPGLRHFWARFAPGRLYDVPVSMGKLPSPVRFEDLNPYPIFM